MARIIYEHEARSALAEGAHAFARAVGSTLGPGGRNVGIFSRGRVALTKDGVTVARETTLAEPFPGVSARMVRHASEAVSKAAGDGTTTVAVLTDAILQEAHRLVIAGFSPALLAKEIRATALEIIRVLQASAVQINTRDGVFGICRIAANGDEEIAHLVADAMEQAGPKGIVTIEDSVKGYCALRAVTGAQYPTGWVTPDFATNREKMTTTLQNPYILLAEVNLFPMAPLFPILEKVYSAGRQLLIVALSVSGPALKTLVTNLHKKTLQACAVPAPYFSDIATESLRDIAALTGGTVYSPFTGRRFESLTLADLGEARSVTVGKRTTTIICDQRHGGALARIAQLEAQHAREPNSHEKERLRERLSKLAGSVAVLEVGAATETELKERRDRIDDALHAARAALEHGVLAGGGLALFKAAHEVYADSGTSIHATAVNLLRRACAAPLRRIARNAGANPDNVEAQIRANDFQLGYDAKAGVLCDLQQAGILDPAQVTVMALAKAAETAALMLNTGCIILKGGK